MGSDRRLRLAVRFAVLLLPLGCSGESLEEPEPSPPSLAAGVLILSEPQPAPVGQVAFASLPPGTTTGGLRAVVRNLRNGSSVEAALVAGGMDPVAIGGEDGDSIVVDIPNAPEGQPSYVDILKKGRPPVVVRSGPTRGAQQVSLNASIVLVFSSPMREATISGETVHLLSGGEEVPATVRLGEDRLRIEITPTGGLQASRDYEVVVSGQVRSATDRPLGADYRTGFRTMDRATVRAVTISGALARPDLGRPVQLGVTVLDSAGNTLTDRAVTWSATAEGFVDAAGTARVTVPGRAVFTAAVEGVTAEVAMESDPVRFTDVSAGEHHSCAVAVNGMVYCWGSDTRDQIGFDGIRRAEPWATDSGPAGMVAAGTGLCLGPASGPVRCRSDFANQFISFDNGPFVPFLEYVNEVLLTIVPVSALALDHAKGCVVGPVDTRCWGDWQNYVDPYRPGQELGMEPGTPIATEPLRSLTVGGEHACGIESAGTVVCWGSNIVGELGNGTVYGNSLLKGEPWVSRVGGDVRFVQVSAGGHHTCGLDASGAAYCWGDGAAGQLGTPEAHECGWTSLRVERFCRTLPAPVSGGLRFASIYAGSTFTCALTAAGDAYCWGNNRDGHFGNGTRVESTSPVPAAVGHRWRRLDPGMLHVCGMTVDDVAYCWGEGAEGRLGNGVMNADALVPAPVLYQAGQP
ncbi:MAG TPA: Ig-like domain-containing protein [Gemmatimonadales bacterium]|nr:Ig-like domain-containing protein [Gemmatimonadales bacterium]